MGLLVLAMSLGHIGAYAQQRVINGTVVDDVDGEPIPGVNILDKASGTGALTNLDGRFQINVSNESQLEISFVGYETQTVSVGALSELSIRMKLDIKELQEIVVIGYGQIEKRDATGVVQEVNAKEFNQGVLAAPSNLLAGKIAGVQVSSPGGQPGAATKIRIRGGTSLNGSNEPLFVVDGVPIDTDGHNPGKKQRGTSALNFINPADIESMTVLKDASAAAIYGSRAANGVILITTKSGKPGKLKVSYDGSVTVSEFVADNPFHSPSEFRDLISFKEPDKVDELGDANTDWIEEVTQTAIGQRHLVTASKADEKNNIYASASYFKTQGVLKTSETENLNVSARYQRKLLNDDLNVKLNVKGGWSDDVYAAEVMNQALIFDPTRPVFNEDGTYFEWNNKLATRNPVARLNQTQELGNIDRYLVNGQIDYRLPFLKDLRYNLNLSYDYQEGTRTLSESEDRALANFSDPPTGRFYFQEDFERKSKMLETYVTYNKRLESIKSKFDLMGGYSYQQWNNRFDFFELDSANVALESGGGAWDESFFDLNDSSLLENRLISFYGRLNYSLADKYLLTASIRQDGSTRFAPENQWGTFVSTAFAWRVSDESFMSGTANWLSNLKLRLGYGQIGNQEIDDYLYVSLYEFGQTDASYQFGDRYVQTLRPTGADPNIKWEETESWNAGVDFGFLDGRVYGTVDVYRKNTNDLLNEVAIDPGSNVRDQLWKNVGAVRNEGVELTLSSTIVDNDNFSWSTSFNISTNKNEVLEIDATGGNVVYERGNIAGDVGQTIQVLQVGKPAFSFRTYKQKYGEGGKPLRDNKDHDGNGIINDLDMFEDLNGDGTITPDDRYVGKNPAPDWVAGLTSNMSYKSFDLSFTFRGNWGNYVYNNVNSANNGYSLITNQEINNIHKDTRNTDFNQKQLDSDYFIENASFVRLDNISLGYTMDQLKFMRVRVYGTLQNLWTVTGYSGVDPEISLLGDGKSTNGIDNNVYPRSLTAILGVNVTF